MASREQLAFGAIVAGGVLWWWLRDAKSSPTLTAEAIAYASTSYDPYTHWLHHREGSYYLSAYPTVIGPTCLPRVLQNSDGTLSTGGSGTADG